MNPQQTPPHRPELERELAETAVIGDVERPLTLHERIASNDAVQRLTILVALIVVWEIYARWLNNSLLFPTFSETVRTFGKDIANGVLIDAARRQQILKNAVFMASRRPSGRPE